MVENSGLQINEDQAAAEAARVEALSGDAIEVDFLHQIGSRLAASDPLHEVLDQVVEFVSEVIKPDSCFHLCSRSQ